MSDELVRLYQRVQRESAGDVFAFLKTHRDLPSDQLSSILVSDQTFRWNAGLPLLVEDYIDRLPNLADNDPVILRLALAEYRLRFGTSGIQVRPSDREMFFFRFPRVSAQLREAIRQPTGDAEVIPKSVLFKPSQECPEQISHDASDQSLSPATAQFTVEDVASGKDSGTRTAGGDRCEAESSDSPQTRTVIGMAGTDEEDDVQPNDGVSADDFVVTLTGENRAAVIAPDEGPNGELNSAAAVSARDVSPATLAMDAGGTPRPVPDNAIRREKTRQQISDGGFRLSESPKSGSASDTSTHISDSVVPQPNSGTIGVRAVRTDRQIGDVLNGRYRITRLLGEGAFGQVFLAADEELHRSVAVKIPTPERFQRTQDVDLYLSEARMVAGLDHPGIVTVYDMGRTPEGSVYVVSRFIEGGTLEERLLKALLSFTDVARMMERIADALHYAHQRRLVHRDVKPANILIEEATDTAFVTDFGLAIREEDFLRSVGISGTPAYMSPEQASGEGHRLDCRSDIFSLGVILYEMLAGKRPFRGHHVTEVLRLVISAEAVSPRTLREEIPVELERICQKAMQRRASDRYATAQEMAEDLNAWLRLQAAGGRLLNAAESEIVPRGLRSFDSGDADFFLDLLPGPRDRSGLPESIGFWKHRLEQRDSQNTFRVGVIYGPSGCGKTSLVKAGLLPSLEPAILAVYVEATPQDTENRILLKLRNPLPELPQHLDLPESMTFLRRHSGRKVVLIIDQFEQWLYSHRVDSDNELVKALRQCDGGQLQAVVMVRDDFWLAASRFMDSIEVELSQGHNISLVDLFDTDHAERVLIRFGRAFQRLPPGSQPLTEEQLRFIRAVTSGLSRDGKVISVRLSLFADMVKSKPWTLATLQQVGGTDGVGANFLEETFAARDATARHRQHQSAARAVLRALLPGAGTDIKGHMRSHSELLEVSGYWDRPNEFTELVRVLDGELRLITPTDPDGEQVDAASRSSEKYYQLTHDYLVPSLRDWLTRKQKETRQGRAELRLEERSGLWNSRRETRHLPSLTEWISIRLLTPSRLWTDPQQLMMKHAGRVHGMRLMLWGALAAVSIVTAVQQNRYSEERRNQAEASRLVEGLLRADTSRVGGSIDSLQPFRRWTDPLLAAAFSESDELSAAKLHAALALTCKSLDNPERASDGSPTEPTVHSDTLMKSSDPSVGKFLLNRLLTVSPEYLTHVRDLLQPHRMAFTDEYWNVLRNDAESPERRLHAACVLAKFDSGHSAWNDAALTAFLAEQLVHVSPAHIVQYKNLCEPLAPQLVPQLTAIFKDVSQGELVRTLATELLADYAADSPDILTDLLVSAEDRPFRELFPVVKQHSSEAIRRLEQELEQPLPTPWNDVSPNPSWAEPSPELRTQLQKAHGIISERFAFCSDLPREQLSECSDALKACGYRPLKIRPWLTTDIGGKDAGKQNVGTGKSTEPDSVQVAAVWCRDGVDWKIRLDVPQSELEQLLHPPDAPGMILCDAAVVPSTSSEAPVLYAVVWSETAGSNDDRRIRADLTAAELQTASVQLAADGYKCIRSLSARVDSAKTPRFTAIWSNQGAVSEFRPAWSGFELFDQPQADITTFDVSAGTGGDVPAATVPGEKDAAGAAPSASAASVTWYGGVWHADPAIESRLVALKTPHEVSSVLRPLLDEGYRPVSIAASSQQTTLVLHRPMVPESARDLQARRQATAAAALLKLNASEKVWPLLRHRPDSRLRSLIVHRLVPTGVDPSILLSQLDTEEKASGIRSLILGLGEFARARQLTAALRTAVLGHLSKLYSENPDPGIHGAAEWALRQLDAGTIITRVQEASAQGVPAGKRMWFVTKTGQHTLAILRPESPFLMGSPVSESERFQGVTGKNEIRHRRAIGRTFAIGTHEVTIAQFQAFRSQHSFDRSLGRDPDAPANMITWYDAAAFCNWLSEQEGIPRTQWCYDPDQPFAEGMTLLPDYLHRTGYRLPTEAEWEFACRAGTTTARHFGETDTLLSQYARYMAAADQPMLRTGSLKPNDAGLFDTLGNALEWCHDRVQLFDTSYAWMDDREQVETLANAQSRALRGGSVFATASFVRSALRVNYQPDSRASVAGFRIARTIR